MIAFLTRKQQPVLVPGIYICRYLANGSQVAERVEVVRKIRGGYLVLARNEQIGKVIRQRLTRKQVEQANWKRID